MAKKSQKQKQKQPQGKQKTNLKSPTSRKNQNLLVAHGGPRFTQINYILMGVGILLLVIGYILVSGGRQDFNEFNEEEIYSTTRLTIAPILILAGFVVEIIAIFYKSKKADPTTEAEA